MNYSRGWIGNLVFFNRVILTLEAGLTFILVLSCTPAPDHSWTDKNTPAEAENSAQALKPARSPQAPLKQSPVPIQSPTPPETPAGPISKSAYAGSWYSSDTQNLTAEVDGYLANLHPVDGSPLVLIVPQTQYAFSGKISATGYQQLTNGSYETAIILATGMYPPHPSPIAIWPKGAFETPLGLVEVDQPLAESIVSASPLIKIDSDVFTTEPGIEIQLPFLQRVCPKCRIVPILIDDGNEKAVEVLAPILAQAMRKEKTVLIVGSNLSQFPNQQDAMPQDNETLSAIQSGDPDLFSAVVTECRSKNIPGLETCANGETAILTAMKTAKILGAETVSILNYGNSGDSTNGDPEHVVGFGVVMFWHFEPPVLNEESRQKLLSIAHATLANRLSNEKNPPPFVDEPEFQRKSGAFVVLELDGKIRGSMGHMRADLPLAVVIQEMTAAAITADPRLTPLTAEELRRLKIKISITSPLHRLENIDGIVLGTHGLLIQERNHQGVLLPQVPIENKWGRNRFLDHLCMVAGLPLNCWKEGPIVYTFTANTFGD